jgi:hypothetical protein
MDFSHVQATMDCAVSAAISFRGCWFVERALLSNPVSWLFDFSPIDAV